MKAEERKEIETNSLVLAVQRLRQRLTGRNLYYLVGTVALVVGAILLYRYLTGEKAKARDAGWIQLKNSDSPEKDKQGMEDHRGTLLGSIFKMQLARYRLRTEGLPKLGTDSAETRKQAAASVDEARTYFLELTGELKEKETADLLQEAWLGAAQAEEALVGMPTAEGGNDSRGSADKAIEYYDKAAAIFPDSEPSKRYKARAEKLRTTKEQFVAAQKALYKPREAVALPPPPAGKDPFGRDMFQGFPKAGSPGPTIDVPAPPAPKGDTTPKGETPPPPVPPEPKPAETPKADPKAK